MDADSGRRNVLWSWRWKYLFWVLPLALMLFVVLSELIGWSFLRQPMARVLSAKLDRRVELGAPFNVHLLRWRIAIQLGFLKVSAPEGSKASHFANAEDIEAEVNWGALLGRRLLLHRLAVGRSDVRAELDADGQASWSMGTKGGTDPNWASQPLEVEQLSVRDLTVTLRDVKHELSLDVSAKAGESNGPGRDGRPQPGLVLSGRGSWRNDPVSFEMRTAGLLPILEGGTPTDVELTGKLKSTEFAFNGSISDMMQFTSVSGKVSAHGGSIGDLSIIPGVALPTTPPFRLEGTIVRKGSMTKVDVTKAETGSSSLRAKLQYDTSAATPTLRGTVKASRLVLLDLGPTIGAGGRRTGNGNLEQAQKKDRPKKGGTRKEVSVGSGSSMLPSREFHVPSLQAMNAEIGINLNKLDLGTPALTPLNNLKATLHLEGGVLTLREIVSNVAGGRLTGSLSLDGASTEKTPVFASKLRWQGVDLKNWVKAGRDGYFVSGRFNGETLLKGQGNSVASISKTLGGTVKGHVDDGSVSRQLVALAGLDAARAFSSEFKGDKHLALTCALISFGVDKGIVRSDLFLLNTTDMLFFVEGTADLGSERLNLRLVQSPKNWSPQSLRSPLTITGTLVNPTVGVDPAPVAIKVLSSVVLAAVSPLAAILPLIELGDKAAKSGCEPAIKTVKAKAAELGPISGPSPSEEEKPAGSSSTVDKKVPRRP